MYAYLCVACVKESSVRLTRVDLLRCVPQLSGPGSVAPVRVPPGRYRVVWLLQVAQGHDSVTQVIACRVIAAGKPRWAPVAAHKLIPREVRTYVLAAHRVSWHGSPLCRAPTGRWRRSTWCSRARTGTQVTPTPLLLPTEGTYAPWCTRTGCTEALPTSYAVTAGRHQAARSHAGCRCWISSARSLRCSRSG